ncbi:MAG: hypothetical protein KDB80_08380 [Planctomycetes bacterium]|nr:hypothetical protein [Planctomycetota bacterium]
MASPADRCPDLLVVCAEPRAGELLADGLARHDLAADIAQTLAEARAAFFRRGGHDAVILVDVPTSLAERAVHALRDLDPEVAIIAFGRDLVHAELPGTTTRLPELHPSSRAGIGAILRVLANLR